MKTTNLELANTKSFPSFSQDTISKKNKLNDQLSSHCKILRKPRKSQPKKKIHDNLKHELLKKTRQREKFKPIMGKIEDFFKLLKQGPNMREIQKYTPKLVEKNAYLNVFLSS